MDFYGDAFEIQCDSMWFLTKAGIPDNRPEIEEQNHEKQQGIYLHNYIGDDACGVGFAGLLIHGQNRAKR